MGVKVMGWKDFYWWHLWIECRHSHSYRQCFSYHLTGMMSVHVGIHVHCPSSKLYCFFLQWNNTATSCSTTLSPFLLLKPKWAHRKLFPLSFWSPWTLCFGLEHPSLDLVEQLLILRYVPRYTNRTGTPVFFKPIPICIRYLYTGTQP